MSTDIQHQTVTINGVEYIRKDAVSTVPMGDVRIIIADRGWVFVGHCQDHEDGSVTITKCRNIRKWGTKGGLGALVNGPLSDTISDDYGTVKCLPVATIAVVKGW